MLEYIPADLEQVRLGDSLFVASYHPCGGRDIDFLGKIHEIDHVTGEVKVDGFDRSFTLLGSHVPRFLISIKYTGE